MRFVRLFLLLLSASMVVTPSVASACRIGGDAILFEEAPPADVLQGAETIRVHFTNVGPEVERWQRRAPHANERSDVLDSTLIGVAQVLDGNRSADGLFPVYATVTSCTHGFWSMAFGKANPVWNGEYFLIGRFVSDTNGRRFQAGGNWNGRWHY
jgi:hypothetical protein